MTSTYIYEGRIRGAVAEVLDYDIMEYEFDIQSSCYVHFRTNTLVKDMNSLILELWVI